MSLGPSLWILLALEEHDLSGVEVTALPTPCATGRWGGWAGLGAGV